MPDPTTENRPAPVLSSGRTFTTEEAMRLLDYTDSTTFWQSVKRAGIPFVRVSARKALFRERDLEAWMDARTVGAPARPATTTGGAL